MVNSGEMKLKAMQIGHTLLIGKDRGGGQDLDIGQQIIGEIGLTANGAHSDAQPG